MVYVSKIIIINTKSVNDGEKNLLLLQSGAPLLLHKTIPFIPGECVW
jgi:hypothetical protein